MISACIVPSQQSVKSQEIQSSNEPKTETDPGKLLKPTIQEKSPGQNIKEPEIKETLAPASNESMTTVPKPSPQLHVEVPETKSAAKVNWEDQKVRKAALDLAEGNPSVKKIKICYAVKEDEWWVTLYEFSGGLVELKQFTWNREQDKLESFLVLKRIAIGRLEEHLNSEEPGKACESIDPLPLNQIPGENPEANPSH
jgi:hypothetical protein